MMNTYQQGFKTDILNAIFNLTGKLWLKITGAYTIQYIVMMVFMLIGFASLGIFNNIMAIGSMKNPQDILSFYQSFFESFTITPKFFVIVFVIVIVVGIISAWFYNFAFILTDNQIKKDKSDFGELFQNSLSKDVMRIFGVAILLYLITVAGLVVVLATSAVSVLLMIVMLLLFFAFMNKFFLVMPALIVGKMDVSASFAYSFKYMTINRCFKLFGIMILTFIALIVIAMIIGLIAGIFSFIPVLGKIMQYAVQIAIGGFTATLTVSALTGLYYRYAPEIGGNEDIDVDNLLVSE